MNVYKGIRRAKTTGQWDREGELVHRLAKTVPSFGLRGDRHALHVGIGDDAAVFRGSPAREWVISCDASLEGVHFHASGQPADSVGYKSLARATSDLAAMGAKPRYFLLTLALPKSKTGPWLDRFASGLARAAREFDIRLVGGDTSQSAVVILSITVLGEIARGQAVLRAGARPGDLIYVSGALGAAQLGLEIVRLGLGRNPSLAKFVRAHFYPSIRLQLGEWLAARRFASAMMDLSDGLSTDLARLCAASGVGARIWESKLPRISVPASLATRGFDALHLSLHGGDDYELLFAAPPRFARLLRRPPGAPRVTPIGEITKQRKILLVQSDGKASDLPARGWDPFR
jgi:thiamine-monophosphate kinase